MLFTDSTNVNISIIIPLYKGEQYIDGLMQMVRTNYLYMDMYKECKLEVIFVNDFPEQEIKIGEDIFAVKVVTNSENQGIHKSRINGIEQAAGEYIILFDQDDLIRNNYLYSQWKKIKSNNADFCVCKGWSSRFRTIGNIKNYEMQINNLEYYFTTGNPIMSPGQVIIKKDNIPKEWIKNVLDRNGADDCLLWMLILLTGGRFMVNEEYLFYHTPERTSDSVSSNAMTESLKEMKMILKRIGFLSEIREKQLDQQLIERGFVNGIIPDVTENSSICSKEKMSYITKFRKMFFLMLDWNQIKQQGKSIADYLIENGCQNVAIQGMGYIGELLYEELKNSSINVKYAIDRSALDFKEELQIIKMDQDFSEVDLIISTVFDNADDLLQTLKAKSKCEVVRIDEILFAIKE